MENLYCVYFGKFDKLHLLNNLSHKASYNSVQWAWLEWMYGQLLYCHNTSKD